MEVLTLEGFLDPGAVAQALAIATGSKQADGALTAGRYAAPVKRSRHAIGREADAWCAELVDRLFNSEAIAHFAFPQRAVHPFLVTYAAGEGYGPHDDNPLQSGMRTDFSFTLFLSAPENYSGGELVLTGAGGEQPSKPPEGTLVLYKTGIEHHVRTVTEGSRTVAVGWLQSTIRDSAERALLRDFAKALRELEGIADTQSQAFRTLNRVRNELVRRWAET